ncbi:MAG: hypothetical protein A3H31_10925 [Gallionellales bacterium RIFCSPLOWO2_02_FULL_57_47]|nr:MAG: hypothetical protein A3H31_10925 [Gallionellales bacterium RIFCSPLOWO2_02_FULL_57_47]
MDDFPTGLFYQGDNDAPLSIRVAVDVGSTRHRVAVGLPDGKILDEFDIRPHGQTTKDFRDRPSFSAGAANSGMDNKRYSKRIIEFFSTSSGIRETGLSRF